MPGRPPLPYRWELHLAVGVLGLLLASATRKLDSESLAALRTPELQAWREARRAEQASWLGAFARERNALRGVTSLLLAWRSFHLERAARRLG